MWAAEHWETVLAIGGPALGFVVWVGKVTLAVGKGQGEIVSTLRALSDKVDTLRDDARDDIGELRKALARVESGLDQEREARDRAVIALRTEISRKRSHTPPQQSGRG